MNSRVYCRIGGTIFGAVAIGHVARIALCLPIHVGDLQIPMWVSWGGAVVTGVLCFLGFRCARRG
jgi:hypothetical protein